MRKYYVKIEVTLRKFLKDASNEITETKDAGIILKKYAKGHKLTRLEKKQIKQQTYDVLKSVGIGVPFVLIPGASVLLPFLIHIASKHNIDLLPSSFSNKKAKKD